MTKDIDQLRKQIDALDSKILELLKERADVARLIGKSKEDDNPEAAIYSPSRERAHLSDLLKDNQDVLPDASVETIFREIMSACRALERETTVAYLGPQGTYTMEAVYRQFGHSIHSKSLPAIEEVFRSVEAGESDYGVVPIENSTEGAVTSTLDCFVTSPLKIIGEVRLRISHCLLSKEQDLKAIQVVYSHEQSLAQCRQWIGSRLDPACRQVHLDSTVLAARRAAGEKGAAAIASAAAAELEGLPIVAKDIEDRPENETRFLVIGQQLVSASGTDKTSVIVSTPNQPGALAGLLQILSSHQLSLTRIESRPAHTSNWEYLFFLDIEGHYEDAAVAKGLAELEAAASFYKLLGSYSYAAER